MKFMMIFEGVDRASKVMNKLMAAEKKTAAATKAGAKASQNAANNTARAVERQASAISRVGSAMRTSYSAVAGTLNRVGSASKVAFNLIVSGAQAAGRAVAKLHRQTVALGKAGFNQIASGAGKAFRGLTVAAGIAATLFASSALAANQFLDVAKKFQNYNIQLETLEGSSEKAQKAMAWISKFAVDTPLELDQVVESYRSLKTFGLDPTNGTLQSLVDTMAASGKGVEHLEGLTLALGQAWTKGKLQGEEALQLLERGVPVWDILSKKYGKNAAALQEMASKGQLGREAIVYLIEEMGRRNAGASEKMSRTWDGMIGNIVDAWKRFQLAVMSAGLFDWMMSKLQLALNLINKLSADGTLQKWAETVSRRIITVFDATWQFAQGVWSVMERLGKALAVAATYVGGWENLAVVLAGLAFAPTLIATAAGLVQIGIGLSMIATALAANPIVLAIAAIAAGAALIYLNWNGISSFFSRIWASITAGAQAAWNRLKSVLGFDPGPILSALWSANKLFAAMAIDGIYRLVSAAWEKVKAVFNWSPVAAIQSVWNSIPAFDWTAIVAPLKWETLITAPLNLARFIVSFEWKDYLPSFSWPDFPAFSWPSLPAFTWPKFPALELPNLKALTYWLKLAAAELAGFSWPKLPTLSLPELPNIAEWIGAFGDQAMVAIDAVSARLGNAWSRVKSAFSFGDDAAATASISVTDPATIKAAAAATAALKADMQSVAAIDTGPAMGKLAALDAAAKRVGQSVMSSIRTAQAFLGAISFYPQGVALMDTLAAGIRARAAVVIEEIRKMTQMVRDHLPSSPAKTGPLSDIHRLKFGETIAGSIDAAPMVKAMRAAAAATMTAAAISMPSLPAQARSLPSDANAQTAQIARNDVARNDVARAAVARVSVQSQAASQPAASPIVVHFKPQAAITANNPEDMRRQWDEMMKASGRQIAELVDEELRRRARSNV